MDSKVLREWYFGCGIKSISFGILVVVAKSISERVSHSTTKMQENIEGVEAIILSEINVKEIEYLNEDSDVLTKQIKPNFKTLGPKFGKDMKLIAAKISSFTSDDIKQIEKEGEYQINEEITISISDVEITRVMTDIEILASSYLDIDEIEDENEDKNN